MNAAASNPLLLVIAVVAVVFNLVSEQERPKSSETRTAVHVK